MNTKQIKTLSRPFSSKSKVKQNKQYSDRNYSSIKSANLKKVRDKTLPILKTNNVEFAAVFGSQARGEAKKKSDIDLLVKFSKPKSLLEIVRLENKLAKSLGNKVDLVTEGALSPYIKPYILKDLKVIYERR